MIESLGRRLRVVSGRPEPAAPVDVPVVPATPAVPQLQDVDFLAYGDDCVLAGTIRMGAGRLTDLLNEQQEYQLFDVVVESLVDERRVAIAEIRVGRHELFLVHGAGPRGDEERRHRTRSHPVAIQAGPYHVRGYLHGLPSLDPVVTFGRREPMVPLTDAWIEFIEGGERERRRVGTVVVNRNRIDWIVPAVVDEVEMPDLPLNVEQGKLLKDYTGILFEDS
jgi:hypothetical protein